jgi:hypothetical protein
VRCLNTAPFHPQADCGLADSEGRLPLDFAEDDEMRRLLEIGGANRQTKVRRCKAPATDSCPSQPDSMLLKSPPPVAHAVLVFTGLSGADREAAVSAAAKLGAPVTSDVTPEVTHVVTPVDAAGACKRTFKYLSAVLAGKRVVGLPWLTKSAHEKGFLAEAPYEPSSDGFGRHAVMRSCKNAAANQPKLFHHCEFYFEGDFSKERMKEIHLDQLITLGGGTVLTREPRSGSTLRPHHAHEHKKKYVISGPFACSALEACQSRSC